MRSKILFWLLAIIVFGGLIGIGFFFLDNLTKFLITEFVALLALLLFIFLYQRLIKPYQMILDGMELLKEQDFSSRLRPVSDSEANKLVEVFNKMMEQLKNERLHVRERNHFLDLLIQASPQGVIILDFDENISAINPAGQRLLNIRNAENVIGKKLDDAGIYIGKSLSGLVPGSDVVVRGTGITMYRCSRSSFIDRGFSHPFILIEELTHELLETEKKSYESIIRMMAHEVNNSIGAVSSTLNVISDTLRQDKDNELSDVLPAVDASYDRCQNLGEFVSNFAQVVKIPEPSRSKVNINELVRSVDALCNIECQRRDIKLLLDLSIDSHIVEIDGIQFEQVLVNIVKNAYESIGRDGIIHMSTKLNPLSISVKDNGPGISEEVKDKLFTPFFTTKTKGQGIGLMFIHEVLLNHKCGFDLYTKDGWTEFVITFD